MAYKIIILRNKLSFSLEEDCKKAIEYFKTRLPFAVEFTFKEVDIPVTTKIYKVVQGFDTKTGALALVNYLGLVDDVKHACRNFVKEKEYDTVIFAWDLDTVKEPNGSITSWTNYNPLYFDTEYIQLAINKYLKDKGDIWTRIAHEMMHSFCYKLNRRGYSVLDEMDNTIVNGKVVPFFLNDIPTALDGNYAHTLKNISPYFDKLTIVKYKWFSDAEVNKWKLTPELWAKLDSAREAAKTAFRITSGLRTVAENTAVGGVDGSEHILGLGCDVLADTSEKRFRIVSGALQAGFTRIGVYTNHIHLGLGKLPTFAENVLWVTNKD